MEEDNKNQDGSKTESIDSGSTKSIRIIPQRLGQFQIDSEISSGGMGTVYKAFDNSMKRFVALKVLHKSLLLSSKGSERFAREAWIAGQLEHPNIVKVFSRGEEQGLSFFAMELIEGGSLSDMIADLRKKRKAKPDTEDTISSEHIKFVLIRFIDLCGALEHVHSKRFIHRDIKPHNILISGDDKQFMLVDFGIAHADDLTRMTRAGDFIGTVQYMSPELLAAHRAGIDARTDIYSMGVTLYEALTLHLPFSADSEEQLIGEILSGHVIPARRRSKQIPRDLETVLMKATHHDPDIRYVSASEMSDDLNRVLRNEPVHAKRAGIVKRLVKFATRHRNIIALQLSGLAVIITLGYSYYQDQHVQSINQQIIQDLKRAVETKSSPFDFDPDWPKLSEHLYKHLQSNYDDSIAKWFYRANSLYDIRLNRYSLRSHLQLRVVPQSIMLFNESPNSNALHILEDSWIYMRVGSTDWRPIVRFGSLYGRSRLILTNYMRKMNDLIDVNLGHVNFEFRIVSRSFRQSDLYVHIRGLSGQRALKMGEELFLSPGGDSLVKMIDYDVKKYPGFDIGYRDTLVLDAKTLSSTQPILVDTSQIEIKVLLFEKWPENFPTPNFDHSLYEDIREGFKIDSVKIIKIDTLIVWDTAFLVPKYKLRFNCTLPPNLPAPILGEFVIIGSPLGNKLVSGRLRILQDKMSNFSVIGTIDPSDHKWLGIIGDQGFELTRTYWRWLWESERDLDNLPELVPYEGSALLRIIPSIEVARFFGDVVNFWGDTLEFPVYYRVIDSSDDR